MMNRSGHRRRERSVSDKVKEPSMSLKSVNWNRLFGYLKPYRGRMGLAILALLLSSGFGLAFPLVIVRLLDSVTKANNFGPLNMLAGILVVIFFAASRLQLYPVVPADLYR